ncbi:pfkB domain-containing protein [Trichonephila clavipes]|nr:pfkB domain-containing protein [Trichonephila clavipes]
MSIFCKIGELSAGLRSWFVAGLLYPRLRMDGRTLDGKVESTAGGVGRNLADCLTRLELNPFFVSNVGSQEHAQALLSKMGHMVSLFWK